LRLGRATGLTDPGRRRLRNEDAFICEPPLFAVADGMGGARAGEIAAGLAAAALEEAGSETRGTEGVVALITEANRRIWERSLADPQTAGMGTTVTAALVDTSTGTVGIGHVGDSRAYLLRGDELEQLTTDHSLVAELVQSGVLTPEEAERHPQRSAITRALGTEPSVEVDTVTVQAEPGDLFLVCSDGLPVMVSDDEILSAIEGGGREPARAAEALVAAANARGGEDNVTVVLFELLDDAASPDEPPQEDAPTSVGLDGNGTKEHATTDLEPETYGVASHDTLRRHGAGPGGRVAALILIAGVLVLGLVALYLATQQ
jgi:protein phosphatase